MKKNIIIKYSDTISWNFVGDEVFIFDEIKDKIKVLKNEQSKLWIKIGEYQKKKYFWNENLLTEKEKVTLKKWYKQGLVTM